MIYPVSRELAAWVANLNWDDIPETVRHHLKLCLLDTVGCGLYGATQTWGRIVAQTAIATSHSGSVALFAGGGCASPSEAALANGTACHGFEIDDVHVASSLHPGAVVIPAVMAVMGAARRVVNGRELIVALAAGYEAGIRVGITAGVKHSTSGYHVTASVGTVAAGMAAARLLNLNSEQTLNALGIAATQASGLYSARKNAMTKRLHAGLAARAGVTGALLAQRGFTGATDVLEAEFGGFFSTLNGGHPPQTVLEELGTRWETSKVGFKAYASCASSHTTVDALDELMAQGLTADNLKRLDLAFSHKGSINVGWEYTPSTVISAQMNAQYVAAVKLLEGEVFVHQFREELLSHPKVLDIVQHIVPSHDPEIDVLGAAKRHTVIAVATLTDGRKLSTRVEQRKGSAEHPLTQAEIIKKFSDVTAASTFIDSNALQNDILEIDQSPDAYAILCEPLLAPNHPR